MPPVRQIGRARRSGHILRWLLPAWLLALPPVHAEPAPRTEAAAPAAVAPAPATPIAAAVTGMPAADDVSRTVLVGPSGQIFDPDEASPGTWQRRAAGGVSARVTGAVVTGDGPLFVGGARAPLFRFDEGAWHAHPLPNRGPCTLPTDGAPAVAVGRHVYTWRNQRWARLRSARTRITAIWAATDSRVHVATRRGDILRTTPGGWSAIRHPLAADDPVVSITGRASARLYALARSGAVLRLGASHATLVPRAPALSGFEPQVAGTGPDGDLWIAGVIVAPAPAPAAGAVTDVEADTEADTEADADAGGPEARTEDEAPAGTTAEGGASVPARAVLARTRNGTLHLVEQLPALAPGERFTVLRVGPGGSVLVATSTGSVRYRLAGQEATTDWRIGTLLGELPRHFSAFPGRAPAHTR